MARNYPADTQKQKFLEESYNKERDSRLHWFFRSAGSGLPNASKQNEVLRKKIADAYPKPTENMQQLFKSGVAPKSYHKKKSENSDYLEQLASRYSAGADRRLPVVEMKPVNHPARRILYDGFSKEGKGRYQYLQERYQEIPEEKFSFPVLSSWDYGWRLGDVIREEDIRKPAHGRTRIVADTFYTRHTFQPTYNIQSS